MDNNFNNLSLIRLIIKWKWHILIITLVAVICGAVFSSAKFITPLYKSEAIAYPANTSPYSDESETEQMLQIINSQSIADSIIEKYDLWSDYKIDRNYEFAKSYMMYLYHENIKITKTPYDAVSIVVTDKDPETACNIAKDILCFYDLKIRSLHCIKSGEIAAMYARQLINKQQDLENWKQQLVDLGTTYGVANYEEQSREITKAYLSGSQKANELKHNLEQFGPEQIDLENKIIEEAFSYIEIKQEYEEHARILYANLTYSNIVTEPYPADKKCYPVRWIIVVFSGLGALLLTLLILFVIENRKRLLSAEK